MGLLQAMSQGFASVTFVVVCDSSRDHSHDRCTRVTNQSVK